MKVWTNTKFEGRYPVGVAAVVISETREMASILLNQKLLAHGLKTTASPEQFELVPTTHNMAILLADGDY